MTYLSAKPPGAYLFKKMVLIASLLTGIVSCGGDSRSRPDSEQFADLCEAPRVGPDTNGDVFRDQQGSATDEKQFLRSWSDELYLWYDEIKDVDPEPLSVPAYFDTLKTFEETASGKLKDNFHFSANTEDYRRRVQGGASAGYGIAWARRGNFLYVLYVQPDSPAADAGIQRGDKLVALDDIALPTTNEDDRQRANRILSPMQVNLRHDLTLVKRVSGAEERISLMSANVVAVPVQNTKTIDTDLGKVGYLTFNAHNEPSELGLINAFKQFQSSNIDELVVDMRYNGGGFLFVASQLAYMVAGLNATAGKTFSVTQFNDKYTDVDPFGRDIRPIPFLSSSDIVTDPLPSLDLSRVFVLSSDNTCSASEAFINGLRGVDVEVVLIGDSTCGKPYGFFPRDNCSTTWFSVQFQTVNAKGFGEYPNGFTAMNAAKIEGVPVPGCEVLGDDLDHDLGAPEEEKLAAALNYIETGACPSPASASGFAKPNVVRPSYELLNVPEWQKSMILTEPSR